MYKKLYLVTTAACAIALTGVAQAEWLSHSSKTIRDTVYWINHTCKPKKASQVRGSIIERTRHGNPEFHTWCKRGKGNSPTRYSVTNAYSFRDPIGYVRGRMTGKNKVGILGGYDNGRTKVLYILE